MSNMSNVRTGTSFGAVLAAIVSWTVNKSILWAIVHAFFGWFYIIYYALGGGRS